MKQPLSEKYRPKKFEDVIGVGELNKIVEVSKNINNMPHFLFHGPAGTGKTTIAKIIIDNNKPVDVLKTHGKSLGIDFIRNKLVPFSSSMSSVPNKRRIIFIDEFDGASAAAIDDLRATIEKYQRNVVFICTCNYINKLTEPIQSRFALYKFDKLKKEDVISRIKFIIEKESINIENENVLEGIYIKARGDLRKSINIMQQLGANIKVADIKNLNNTAVDILKLIKAGDWETIRRQKVFELEDFEEALSDMDDIIYNSEKITKIQKMKCNQIIAEGLFQMYGIFRRDLLFCAVCSKLVEVLNV